MARFLRMLSVLTACTAAAVMSCTAAAPAVAGVVQPARPFVTTKHTLSYDNSWTWKSSKIAICTVFRATGKFKYTTKTGRNNVQYLHQTVLEPRLTAHTYTLKNGSCGSKHNVHKFAIAQHWTGYSCSFNPHISVGAGITGLSVSLSGWPSCGDRQQAIFSTPYGAGWFAIQDNSASSIAFGNTTSWATATGPPPPVCYGVYPSAEIWISRHHSDSYGAGNLHNSAKVCLTF